VKSANHPERIKVKLPAFQFDAFFAWKVQQTDDAEIRIAGFGAYACKLGKNNSYYTTVFLFGIKRAGESLDLGQKALFKRIVEQCRLMFEHDVNIILPQGEFLLYGFI
jgi:hypothetical protein